MKRLLFLVLVACSLFSVYSQDIPIAIAFHSSNNTTSELNRILKSKMLSIVSSNDGVSSAELGAIVIVPEISNEQTKRVDGGMRSIFYSEIELTISVVNIVSETTFGSMVVSCSGEGYTESNARLNAIQKVNPSSADITGFLKATKNKIFNYYSTNTKLFIQKAKLLAAQQQYDEAFAILSTYPESMPNYEDVCKTIANIFNQYQKHNCGQILMEARSAYSIGDFEKAADLLSVIDAQSSCASEAKALLNDITASIARLQQEERADRLSAAKSKERLQMSLINAAQSIATAYFNRQTNYLFLW